MKIIPLLGVLLFPMAASAAAAPSEAKKLSGQAYSAYSANKYDEAIRLADASIKLDPSDWEAFHFRAWSHYSTGQYAKAASDHAQSVSVGPKTDPYLAFSVALCKSLAGQNQQALEWAGRSLAIDAKFAMALTQQGYVHFDLGQLDKAKENFLAALAADAKRADAHLGLALVESKKGDAFDAKKHLADATTLSPDLDAIDIWMGAKRRFTAKQKAAIAALTRPKK